MKYTHINKEFLEKTNACSDAVIFINKNNLLNFPFDRLDEIQNDYKGYISWVKSKINDEYDVDGNKTHFKNSAGYEEWYEYDVDGNIIYFKDSAGYEISTPTTFYPNGQLKSIGDYNFPLI